MERQMELEQPRGPSAGARADGLSANLLKWIAIAAMVGDHFAVVFLPADSPLYALLRFFGRITGPVMFYFIAEGYHKTSNVNRYTARLAVFAAVSYVPYIYGLYGALPGAGNWTHFDVIFTLFLGLLAVRARHEVENPFLKWALIGGLLLLSVTSDWFYLGILFILIFDYFYGDYKKQAFAYCMVTLLYILPGLARPVSAALLGTGCTLAEFVSAAWRLGMFLPAILLSFYHGKKGRGGKAAKWAFYVIYPAHLAILGLIRDFVVNN